MRLLTAFSRFLPPPSYIALPSVGVDISDTSMKYVSFEPSLRPDPVRVLKSWGDITIPDNVLQRGEITDSKMLTDVLKEFKDKTKAEYIRVSLPEERAYIFETEVKKNEQVKEVQSLLEFRLEENVPISAREAIFDYEILADNDSPHSAKVVVAAYQRETIMQYYEVCRAAGLTPLSFEVEAQAMARSGVAPAMIGSVMLIDFYKTGLVRSADNPAVQEALLSTISVIKDEIASRMQYWHLKDSNRGSRRIKKIILCGGSVNLKGLPEYLTESLGVPCERADVWTNAFRTSVVVPPIEKRFSYGYATAVGLALKNTV